MGRSEPPTGWLERLQVHLQRCTRRKKHLDAVLVMSLLGNHERSGPLAVPVIKLDAWGFDENPQFGDIVVLSGFDESSPTLLVLGVHIRTGLDEQIRDGFRNRINQGGLSVVIAGLDVDVAPQQFADGLVLQGKQSRFAVPSTGIDVSTRVQEHLHNHVAMGNAL